MNESMFNQQASIIPQVCPDMTFATHARPLNAKVRQGTFAIGPPNNSVSGPSNIFAPKPKIISSSSDDESPLVGCRNHPYHCMSRSSSCPWWFSKERWWILVRETVLLKICSKTFKSCVTTPPPPRANPRVWRTACPAFARTHALTRINSRFSSQTIS